MRSRRPLAVRLLALGLAQLAALAIAAIAIAIATRPAAPHDIGTTLEHAIDHLQAIGSDRERLAREIGPLADRLDADLTILGGDGDMIASSIEPPLAPPPPRSARRPPHPPPPGPPPDDGLRLPLFPRHEPPRRVLEERLEGERVLLLRGRAPRTAWLGPIAMVLAGVAVIGTGAMLTARWIVRPLESLTRTARAIGEGDLGTRTGLRRADEIGTVARSFDEMAERIEQLLRAERELLANVSHELRTPLARIRVAMDLAAEGDAEAARASVAEIATDLAELESIVDDVLVALRVETSGRTAVHAGLPLSSLHEVGAREMAERSIDRFRARHPDRTLDATLADDLPSLLVDPVLFRRVIDNLLENAHKYSPDRGAPIALRVSARGEHAVFEIEDRGLGIAADDLPHVFTPFFRGEKSRSRGAGGVGLGLTLAKRIVEAHGGTIELASEPGRGTRARVEVEALPR